MKQIKEDICINKDEFLIVQETDREFNNPLVFLTYPGPGIVGPIIARQMIESLGLEEVGFFKSKSLSPVTMFTNNVLKHPYLIYANKEGSIVLITIDYPIPQESYLAVAEGLLEWIEHELHAEYIVCFDSIPVNVKPSGKIIITAAEKEIAEKLKKYSVELYDNGIVVGLSGALMSEALLRRIIGIVLMTPATAQLPDPEAAADLIDVVNDHFKLSIDTSALLKEAENIKKQLAAIAEKEHAMHRDELPRAKLASLKESFV